MNKCLWCDKPVKNKYCNASCQLKFEYKTGKRKGSETLTKAHETLRTKGHYKRDNSYLVNNNTSKTQKTKDKISKANSGEKNGMFGKTPWNKLPLTKKWWEEKEFVKLRKECIERDNHQCVKCSVSDKVKDLYCDHIIPYRICKEHKLNNLQMLCGKCHSKKTAQDVKLMKKEGYI